MLHLFGGGFGENVRVIKVLVEDLDWSFDELLPYLFLQSQSMVHYPIKYYSLASVIDRVEISTLTAPFFLSFL